MPYKLNEFRAKVQFVTSAQMPALIYQACVATGTVSNTVYIQHAVCAALARDLNIPLDRLLAELPEPRGRAAHPLGPDRTPVTRIGPANTHEHVK